MLKRLTLVGLALVVLAACGGDSPSSSSSPTTTTTTTTLPAQLWTRSGIGNTVFDMPTYVARVHIVGKYTGHSSNFIIWINKPRTLLVNELIGTAWGATTYDAIALTEGGGVVSIENSTGVEWTLTEQR